MNVVAVAGLAGAGKDEVARVLVERHGFVRVGLADEVKRIAARLWDWDEHRLWGPSEARNEVDPRYGFSARTALQLLGTEVGRQIDPAVWTRYALRVANCLLHQSGILRSVFYAYDAQRGLIVSNTPQGPRPRGVVMSDCRFDTEACAVHDVGGVVLRVERPGAGLGGPAGAHVSERGVSDDLVDAIIDNSGPVEALPAAVAAALDRARKVRATDAA